MEMEVFVNLIDLKCAFRRLLTRLPDESEAGGDFIVFSAPRRLLSSPRTTRSFTRLVMTNTTTLQHPRTAPSNDSLAPASAASLSAHNSHSPAASAANASGFLLTALSNARPNARCSTLFQLRASDKALTSLGQCWRARLINGLLKLNWVSVDLTKFQCFFHDCRACVVPRPEQGSLALRRPACLFKPKVPERRSPECVANMFW